MLSGLPPNIDAQCEMWSHLDSAMDIADHYDTLLAQRKNHQMRTSSAADDSVLALMSSSTRLLVQLPYSSYKGQRFSPIPAQTSLDRTRKDLRKSYHIEIDKP